MKIFKRIAYILLYAGSIFYVAIFAILSGLIWIVSGKNFAAKLLNRDFDRTITKLLKL